MISSKYLLWVGFSPPADVGKKQIRQSCPNQVSLATNLEMNASQQKEWVKLSEDNESCQKGDKQSEVPANSHSCWRKTMYPGSIFTVVRAPWNGF